MSAFIDMYRDRFGVEPICTTLGVSASAYYQRATGQMSARTLEDERLTALIVELYEANYCAYGYRRMWKCLLREGEDVGRDHVKRLMHTAGIQGAKRRGKPWRTTVSDPFVNRPRDLVERDFTATRPDQLWVADFTYLRCWEGVVFFSFVIDVFSRRIVGWQFASHMRTDLVLDALRMALTRRQTGADLQLVHHSDAGSQLRFKGSSQHRCRVRVSVAFPLWGRWKRSSFAFACWARGRPAPNWEAGWSASAGAKRPRSVDVLTLPSSAQALRSPRSASRRQ